VLASRVRFASGFFSRLKGLLGSDSLPEGEGLMISPCNSIHMFGMTYAIDAVFLDKNDVVVGLVKEIKPGRMSSVYFRAARCLELPAGTISNTMTEVGDKLIESP